MKQFIEHLDKLKNMLPNETKFGVTFEYFFDHLAEKSAFLELGKKAKNPVIKQIMTAVGKRMFGEETTVTGMMLTLIRAARFYHGTCFVGRRMAVIFFFEDIDMGMAGIHAYAGRMEYIRFSSTIIGEGKAIVLPQDGGNPTVH